ncbi:hypothetical protein VTG60DRAFT_1657 [Thermothelomyces hinnuleus]
MPLRISEFASKQPRAASSRCQRCSHEGLLRPRRGPGQRGQRIGLMGRDTTGRCRQRLLEGVSTKASRIPSIYGG